jgi:hypothetical protein
MAKQIKVWDVEKREDLRGARCGDSALVVTTHTRMESGEKAGITYGILHQRTPEGFKMIQPKLGGRGVSLCAGEYVFSRPEGKIRWLPSEDYNGKEGEPEFDHYVKNLRRMVKLFEEESD